MDADGIWINHADVVAIEGCDARLGLTARKAEPCRYPYLHLYPCHSHPPAVAAAFLELPIDEYISVADSRPDGKIICQIQEEGALI